ncbi:MAG: hypothetical protein M3P18_05050 [Actinomycetota bacterium]|nr:hypothetical protein [Actinomycetota bacterium]
MGIGGTSPQQAVSSRDDEDRHGTIADTDSVASGILARCESGMASAGLNVEDVDHGT